MENKINITSTALEKGIDTVKEFLDKLIAPSVEEVGLLVADKVRLWRVKNQINILKKAQLYCEEKNISTKQISLKLLCPLLDYSSIEEDDFLQNKWAILLSNMVDSEQNIENHVFPYILSQLSHEEFASLEAVCNEKQRNIANKREELKKLQVLKFQTKKNVIEEIKHIDSEISIIKQRTSSNVITDYWKLEQKKQMLKGQVNNLDLKIRSIQRIIDDHAIIPNDAMKGYEFFNLIRLGLIKEEKTYYTDNKVLKVPMSTFESYVDVNLDIDVDWFVEYVVTELGELFISACKEKNQ